MVLTIIDEKGVSCAPHFRLWIFQPFIPYITARFVILRRMPYGTAKAVPKGNLTVESRNATYEVDSRFRAC